MGHVKPKKQIRWNIHDWYLSFENKFKNSLTGRNPQEKDTTKECI
jgi:hypothetical protein